MDHILITFKAGTCNQAGKRVTPQPGAGYIYLYRDSEDLVHFCWRRRSQPANDPDLDLIVFEDDGSFYSVVHEPTDDYTEGMTSPTEGRIFCLKFNSSGQRHYFWLQSASQHPEKQPNWWSERDYRLGVAVNALLSSGDVNVKDIMAGRGQDHSDDDDDEESDDGEDDEGQDEVDDMDVDDSAAHQSQGGGTGAATKGGNAATGGEQSRRGGASGGRAVTAETNAILQNFINSMKTNPNAPQQQTQSDAPFTTLPDLLPASTTIPYLDSASPAAVDNLCAFLPPDLFLLAQESNQSTSSTDPTPAAAQAAIEALSQDQKKSIIKRVLRSPQLQQSLGSLTVALRDGGLPMIGEALGLQLKNGGTIQGGTMPLGGASAVQAFVEGVKETVQKNPGSEADKK